MALDFGPGVSRTLDAASRQFGGLIWKKSSPPLDSEMNLMSQVAWESLGQTVRTMLPSGFFMDPTRAAQDFQMDPNWSNMFKVGAPRVPFGVGEGAEQSPIMWVNVNGWILPLAGTDSADGLENVVKLYPPPESDSRIDFLFLEVWMTRVNANPSTVNKPSASTIWKYGNVKFGGVNLPDDMLDPTIKRGTSSRVQLQYRLRVHGQGTGLGASVALDVYPEGLDDPHVLGQGTAANPVAAVTFTNMREALGDVGLWRAGDGNPNNALGTVDGYTYAVPIAAVFRRASNVYVAVNQAGNPNHNGAFCRTPSTKLLANPLTGARALTTATLTSDLAFDDGADPLGASYSLALTDLNGSGLEDSHVLSSLFLVLDDEIIGISAKNILGGTITIPAGGRGRYGTAAVGHPAGTVVRFFNTRPDGLFSDQVQESDLLDLRHAINPNDWDYGRLLEHNVSALIKGDLRSTWKHAPSGNTQGAVAHEVTYLWGDGSTSTPNHTEAVDGPDGIRTIWSDAAALQPGVTVLLDNTAPQDGNNVGLTNENRFTSGAGYAWDVGANFYPSGFMNVGTDVNKDRFCNGSTIMLFTGGRTGSDGARATFRDGNTRGVRVVSPREYWKTGYPVVDPSNGNQHPVTLRFLDQRATEPSPPGMSSTLAERHVGPMFPWRETNYERPFIVLGGLLRNEMRRTAVQTSGMSLVVGMLAGGATVHQINVGIDFDLLNSYYTLQGSTEFSNDASDPNLTNPLMRDRRTLYGMLTSDGTDTTGLSSEVYVALYGDADSRNNNGAFKVIGAGTVGYTHYSATGPNASTSILVQALSPEFVAFDDATGNTVTVEFRSQETNSDDTSSYDTKVADVLLVLTDIGGLSEHPWKLAYLGSGAPDGYDISMPFAEGHASVGSQMLLDLTLQYHPGRSGIARVPDEVVRFAMKGGTTDSNGAYLRQSPGALDSTFSAVGTPTDETFWDPAHIQLWNRLPSLGWPAPLAPSYGGHVVGYTEQDREHELFFDRGSKTVMFRPFRDRRMTLRELSWSAPDLASDLSLIGEYTYVQGHQKDALRIWTGSNPDQGGTGKKMGFALPWEFMPRFGRQDIPFYQDQDAGAGPFLSGINHLFLDQANVTSPVFHIIGGTATAAGVPAVYPMFFVTGGLGGAPTYGGADTMPTWVNQEFIYARRAPTDINVAITGAQDVVNSLRVVNSSDFGKGLQGIQLPPYYGIARLYGVYDVRDFDWKGGRSFKANRVSVETDAATNLLREDADQQTLFILQGGGKDFGGTDQDHTYIIPYNALDITRSPFYDPNVDSPETLHYVVECTTFGFARGFIDQNNLVLVRKFGGTGLGIDGGMAGNEDGDNLEIKGLHMVLPCPAAYHDQFYVAANRTVYQGDPYMSRGGAKTESDYETRYGQLSVGAQYAMRMPIEQYDSTGAFVPQTPNAKAFEILASLDFYTTLGTGKIGGQLYAGTPLDVGFTEATPQASRRAPELTDYPWRVVSRAFTEGQKGSNNRASLDMVLSADPDVLNPGSGYHAYTRLGLLDGTFVDLYFTKQQHAAALALAVPAINVGTDLVVVPEEVDSKVLAGDYIPGSETLLPGQYVDKTVTLYGAALDDQVTVHWSGVASPDHSLQMRAWVEGPNTITLRYQNMWPWTAFKLPPSLGVGPPTNPRPVVSFLDPIYNTTWTGPTIVPAHDSMTLDLSIPGLTMDTQTLVVNEVLPPVDGLIFIATKWVDGFGSLLVRITAKNTTSAQITITDRDLAITILTEEVAADHTLDTVGFPAHLMVHKKSLYNTGGAALALWSTINSHPSLQRTVKALVTGDNQVTVEAVPTGAQGNDISVRLLTTSTLVDPHFALLKVPRTNERTVGQQATFSHLLGGRDIPFNAGDGTSQINLTGMTERLPLGALLQDSDFLCENPLGDNASALKSSPTGPRPVQTVMPLTSTGGEYTRFFGAPGELLGMSDGSISVTSFGAWRRVAEGGGGPTGSRRFRIYRGGGAAYTLSGLNPGAPVDWVSETFPSTLQPVLKGGVLACRALLVRNFREDVTPSGSTYKVTEGDEIQMVLLTQGLLGDGSSRDHGVSLGGSLSPSGYGEGWAATDRYRVEGKPLFRGYSRRVPDPSTVELVVYPDQQRD